LIAILAIDQLEVTGVTMAVWLMKKKRKKKKRKEETAATRGLICVSDRRNVRILERILFPSKVNRYYQTLSNGGKFRDPRKKKKKKSDSYSHNGSQNRQTARVF